MASHARSIRLLSRAATAAAARRPAPSGGAARAVATAAGAPPPRPRAWRLAVPLPRWATAAPPTDVPLPPPSRTLRTTPPRSASAPTDAGDGADAPDYKYLRVTEEERVVTITLHRPRSLNAVHGAMAGELVAALTAADASSTVGAIVLTGGPTVFAAGADIAEMAATTSYASARFRKDAGAFMDVFPRLRTPVVAAVAGYALGGGCELALAADVVIAEEGATFGQPEVQLGLIPGWGGTQRLVRAVGKAKAMEMVLTGRRMGAEEAERAGLVSRIVAKGRAEGEAADVARVIAGGSAPVVAVAKECVALAAGEADDRGIRFERRAFQALFSLDDAKEGMKAFVDKRTPEWRHH
ncbi:hypothetical protein BU14_0381s0007 [Porphyra umbilicalis]|uniref:Enoyl-CoA hydratase n=1 Tax=Porphyra umbilicalis TaxID=2786 RepID=A0A1X6NX32_PORUM|nr:hypothetical protein BU14_0381s0007 [Porphyra umbilicalis]|eukprot:OSX73066.1 hypothetical protein BU14_0381s0007 [Porphyra umbilicalis]